MKDAEIVLLHVERSFRKRLALENLVIVRHNGNNKFSLVDELVPSVNELIEKDVSRLNHVRFFLVLTCHVIQPSSQDSFGLVLLLLFFPFLS